MKKHLLFLSVVVSLLFFSCQKEVSFETGGNSEGTLQYELTGDCLPKNVAGVYEAGKALTASNFIEVQVVVVKGGAYTITSDTLNGMSFRSTGVFSGPGTATVKLQGTGTPGAAGVTTFTINYDSTECTVAVTILPAGAAAAAFTLDGSPNACMNYHLYGTYSPTVDAGNPANYVVIYVHVTTPGSYNVTTSTGNGLTFTGTGALAATGVDSIKLYASGTPAAAGNTNFIVTAGATTCTFPVTVAAGPSPAVYTLDGSPNACMTYNLYGAYPTNTPLNNPANYVVVYVHVTTAGTYNVTTTAVNGIIFSGSGTLAVGVDSIKLTASGTTPAAAGTSTITVTAGSTTCTFPVPVTAQPSNDYFPRTANSNWSYEFDDDPNDSLYRKATASTKSVGANTYTIFMGTDDISQGLDSSGYYRKNGGDYWEFLDIGTTYGLDNPAWAEYIFLKDNVPAGTAWQSAAYNNMLNGNAITFRLNYSIAQKDITLMVNSISYTNVIVVNEKVDINLGGIWTDATSQLGYTRSYYARGIGLIKFEQLDPTNVVVGQVETRRTQIF